MSEAKVSSFYFSRRLIKSVVLRLVLKKRLAALEPIIFCVSVFLFGAGKKARFLFHRVLGRFLRLLRLCSRNVWGETPEKTVTLYIILNIEKVKKHEIHFSV